MFPKELFLRVGLLLFSGSLFIYILYLIYTLVSPSIELFLESGELVVPEVNLIFLGVLFVISLISYFIGRHWKESVLFLSSSFLSLFVLFLTFGIISLEVSSSSQELVDSLQSSVDVILLTSLEKELPNLVGVQGDSSLQLLFYENSSVYTMNFSNLLVEDGEFLTSQLGLSLPQDQLLPFTEFFLAMISSELEKQDEFFSSIPLPVSELSEIFDQLGYDESFLETMDYTLLTSMYPLPQEGSFSFISYSSTFTQKFYLNNLSEIQVNFLWEELGFPPLSYESKHTFVSLLLSVISDQKAQLGFESQAIPFYIVPQVLREDYAFLFSYDVFHTSGEVRAEEFSHLRTYCDESQKELEVCSYLLLTRYDDFSEMVRSNSTLELEEFFPELEFPPELQQFMTKYPTSDSLVDAIQKQSSNYTTFFLFSFLFLVFSILFYIIHFKYILKETPPKFHVYYFLSKHSFLHFLPFILLLGILYYLLSSGIILESMLSFFPAELSQNLNFFESLPTYLLLVELLGEIFWDYLFFGIIFSLAFVVSFFFLRKELSQE